MGQFAGAAAEALTPQTRAQMEAGGAAAASANEQEKGLLDRKSWGAEGEPGTGLSADLANTRGRSGLDQRASYFKAI